jgi:valyl-tRNA synthetase
MKLATAKKPVWSREKVVPKKMAHFPLSDLDIYVPLEGLVDLASEAKRLEKEIGRLKEDLGRRQKRLEDTNFVTRASADVVEEERGKVEEAQRKLTRLEETLRNISS